MDSGRDAGTTLDAARDAETPDAADGGSTVADAETDAGTDSGTPEDAGADSGDPADAGTDSGTQDDAGFDGGAQADAGTDGGVLTLALTSLTPSSGSFGTRVTITGTGWPSDASGTKAAFAIPGGGTARVPLILTEPGVFTVIVPIPVQASTEVRIEAGGGQSNAIAFDVSAPVDPTPGESGNEANGALVLEGAVFGQADHELGIAYYPLLTDKGYADMVTKISKTLLDMQAALNTYYADQLQSKLGPEGWAFVDAVIGSQAGAEAAAKLESARELLSHSSFGEAIYDLAQAKDDLESARDILNTIKWALAAGEFALAPFPPLVLAAEAARELIDTLVSLIDAVLIVIKQAPTSMISNTFEIYARNPDRHLNQEFYRGSEQNDPACILIPLPVSVRGRVDLDNRNAPGFDGMENIELPGLLSAILDVISLLEPPYLDVNDVDIPLLLKVQTGKQDIVKGEWGVLGLAIQGLSPGDAFVRVYPHMPQIKEDCGFFPDDDCVKLDDVALGRTVRIYERPVVNSVMPDAQFLGENVSVYGECIQIGGDPAMNLFFTPPPNSQYGDGRNWTIAGSFFDYTSEVPDAATGRHWFTIDDVESTKIPLTVRNPLLDKTPPSAIIDEPWTVTGRGFSHTPGNNTAYFNDVAASQWAPTSKTDPDAHRKISITVYPPTITDGMFTVKANGNMNAEQSWPYVVRRLSPLFKHVPDGRAGIRPQLARDDGSGDRAMAWYDTCRNGHQLVVSHLPAGGDTWGAPALVSSEIGGMPGAPAVPGLAMTGGKMLSAWIGRDEHVHIAKSENGTSWSGLQFDDSAIQVVSSVALAAEGQHIVVAWAEEAVLEGGYATVYAKHSGDGGVTWGTRMRLSTPDMDASDPATAMSGGIAAVAWSEQYSGAQSGMRTIRVARSSNSGEALVGALDVHWGAIPDGAVAKYPSVAVRSVCSNPVLVAWEQTNTHGADPDRNIWVAGMTMTGLTVPAYKVTRSDYYAQSPSMGIDADCIPAMAWMEQGHREENACWKPEFQTPLVYLARSFDKGASFQKIDDSADPGKVAYLGIWSGHRLGRTTLAAGGSGLITVAWQNTDLIGARGVFSKTTDGEPAVPTAYPVCQVATQERKMVLHDHESSQAINDVWVTDEDGGRRRRLTRTGVKLGRPSLSPDASRLAYVAKVRFADHGTGDAVFVGEADGRHAYAAVPPCDMMHVNADFAPSGTRIAFQSNSYPGIATLNGVMSGMSYLSWMGLSPWPRSGEPDWDMWKEWNEWVSFSEDKLRKVYVYSRPATDYYQGTLDPLDLSHVSYGRLVVENTDGTGIKSPAPGYTKVFMPAFTRDGHWVVFGDAGTWDLYRIDPDWTGGEPQEPYKIYDAQGKVIWFEPLYDGHSVAVLETDDTGTRLQIVDVNTGSVRQFSPNGGKAGPASAFIFPRCAGTEEVCACTDGQKNYLETDVDCGGGVCAKCMGGAHCSGNGDCASNNCATGVCIGCDDKLQNGAETDVDCGGGTCKKCMAGKKCLIGDDCNGGPCNLESKLCQAVCGNGILETGETCEVDADCGQDKLCKQCACESKPVCGNGTVEPGEDCETINDCPMGRECKECKCEYQDVGLVWVQIPAGTYQMGCVSGDTACGTDELPQHSVTIAAFQMTQTEITQDQYYNITVYKLGTTKARPSYFKYCGGDCPVENVIWDYARDFCKAVGGRLPSESEFEYALRAGATTKYPCGDDPSCLSGTSWNYANSEEKTHPVKGKTVNAFGLYDMSGNVWEWVEDCSSSTYTYNQGPTTEAPWQKDEYSCDTSSYYRRRRGGGYTSGDPAAYWRSSQRAAGAAGPFNFFKEGSTGFRCAK